MNNQNSLPLARVNTGFTKYADPVFLTKSLGIYEGMSGSGAFPAPPVPLADFLTNINNYQASLGLASSRDRDAVLAKSQMRRIVNSNLVALGNYATSAADGDLDILASSRFDIRKKSSPRPPLEKPENIKATDGINPGEVITSVNTVKNAKAYSHEYMPEAATEGTSWTVVNCTSRTCNIKQLTRGTSYVFRIGAIGAYGQLTYSDTVTRVAQ